jgi:NADH dehydrogenase (ubiquinone) 1 alpha/beta subcomplex 1
MAAAARNLVLRHLRLAAAPASAASIRPAAALQGALSGRRWISSEDAKGSFLDKDEVTERTIKVVKNFPKIEDGSKVPHHVPPSLCHLLHPSSTQIGDRGAQCSLFVVTISWIIFCCGGFSIDRCCLKC